MAKEILTQEKETLTQDKLVVETALLQASVSIPGTGKTETTLNHVKVPGIQMHWVKGEGLFISAKGRESFVPSTNVKIIHFLK